MSKARGDPGGEPPISISMFLVLAFGGVFWWAIIAFLVVLFAPPSALLGLAVGGVPAIAAWWIWERHADDLATSYAMGLYRNPRATRWVSLPGETDMAPSHRAVWTWPRRIAGIVMTAFWGIPALVTGAASITGSLESDPEPAVTFTGMIFGITSVLTCGAARMTRKAFA